MNADFKGYVGRRLRDYRYISEPEKDLVRAADLYALSGQYRLVYIKDRSMVIYGCSVNTSFGAAKVSIRSVGEEVPHGLATILECGDGERRRRNSLFSFDKETGKWMSDPYFREYCNLGNVLDALSGALRELGISSGDRLIVADMAFREPPLGYALQSMAAEVHFLDGDRDNVNLNKRIDIPEAFRDAKVGVQPPMDTLLNLKNNDMVYVPLQPRTLESCFFGEFCWKDVLGELAAPSGADVDVCGIPCRAVSLRPYIDAYGNVFISVFSVVDSRYRTCIVAGPGVGCAGKAAAMPSTGPARSGKPEAVSPPRPEGRTPGQAPAGKCYIIDTNVFINAPDIIGKIGRKSLVVLSCTVIDELDKKKRDFGRSGDTEKSENLRTAVRFLTGRAAKEYRIKYEPADMSLLPIDYQDAGSPDNRILSVAMKYKSMGMKPVMLTSDGLFRAKCKSIDIDTVSLQDFLKGQKKQKQNPDGRPE